MKNSDNLRAGISLIEMVVASASATVLISGMASSIYITSLALSDGDGTTARSLDVSFVIDEMLTDLQLAKGFIDRTPHAVEFTVPDRDSDGNDEIIRYEWGGNVGDALTKRFNALPPETLLSRIDDANIKYEVQTVAGIPEPTIPQVVFQSFTEAKETSNSTQIEVAVPGAVQPGDLLVAAVAVREDVEDDFDDDIAGWTLAGTDRNSDKVTLGVWYRIADGNEPSKYTFSWGESEEAYAWIMHFVGNHQIAPVEIAGFRNGKSSRPPAPTADVTTEYSAVLVLGAFHKDEVSQDDAGIPNYATLTLDSASDQVTGGAALKPIHYLGDVDSVDFDLQKSEEYVTATLLLVPAS